MSRPGPLPQLWRSSTRSSTESSVEVHPLRGLTCYATPFQVGIDLPMRQADLRGDGLMGHPFRGRACAPG